MRLIIERLKLITIFLIMPIVVSIGSISCMNDGTTVITESQPSLTSNEPGGVTYRKVLHEGVTDDSGMVGLTEVVAVASGTRHDIMFGLDYGLALKSDGTVWSWIISAAGNQQASEPEEEIGFNDIIAISTCMGNTLALDSEGRVWSWDAFGNTPKGTPVATVTSSSTTAIPKSTANSYPPVLVEGLGRVVAISAGLGFSLALQEDGTVWAWGDNEWGQLGNGSAIDSDSPCRVEDLSNVTAISAGSYHSLALKSDGTVWSWGDNESGELGNGTTANSYVPVQVSGLHRIVAVQAGEAHSLGLKDDGTVWSWGNNENGQAGNETRNSKDDPSVAAPVKISDLNDVVAIAEGGLPGGGPELNGGMVKYGAGYCLALKSDGTVWQWGASGWTDEPSANPYYGKPVLIHNVKYVQGISGGGNYTVIIEQASNVDSSTFFDESTPGAVK